MNFTKSLACATLLVAGLGMSSAIAETHDMDGCHQAQHKLSTAFSANESSPNFDAARDEERKAQDLCRFGKYQIGLDHYAKAMDLLTNKS